MEFGHEDLLLYRDITPLDYPLVAPSEDSPQVLVVGGGVTGLVTAWTLLDHGYKVTVLSKEWASYGKEQRLTSQIAGALWEYPPAVCGQHTDRISLAHSKRWCMTAYRIWDALATDARFGGAIGVRMKPGDFFFPVPVEQDPAQLHKMTEIMASGVRGFKRDPSLVQQRRVDPSHGGVDAYELMSPIIDTDVAMTWLMELVASKGGEFVTETLDQDILSLEHELREKFNAELIVNCTGLAGATLANDKSCYPIRGGLIRVINDGSDFPKVEAALTISADAMHDHNEIVFLVPRNDNILLIGGIAQSHENTLDLTLDSPIIKRMRGRCERFLPDLKHARMDPEYPLAQGLRPFRGNNVRVERELRPALSGRGPSRIVHSYGQGGAGWSLSFGCAGDVLKLCQEALRDSVPVAMGSVPREAAAVVHAIRASL